MTQNTEKINLQRASRTKTVNIHISLSFIYRLLAVLLSYFLVPVMINYLNTELYGIWMTLFSIMTWISFFDIGIGTGLRNKMTEALSLNNIKLAKTYVSTAHFVIACIAFIFLVILLSIMQFTDWTKVFNTTSVSNTELSKAVFVVGISFLLNFLLSLGSHMFYAYQEASMPILKAVLINLFALISMYILIKYTSSSILYLAISYGLSLLLANLLLMFYFFKKHSEVIPSIKYIDLRKLKEITSLGVKFFIIQIASLVIFATDNMIITQLLGPDQVTPYNVVYKLFSIITIGHGIIVATLWSAYTEAYVKGDIKWIKKTLKKLNVLMIPIIISVFLLIIFSKEIINIWVGSNIKFPFLLSLLMGIYVIISVWNNIYLYFVSGIGKINLQMFLAILGGILNIPLSIFFSKYLGMKINGVILGTIISISFFTII